MERNAPQPSGLIDLCLTELIGLDEHLIAAIGTDKEKEARKYHLTRTTTINELLNAHGANSATNKN